MGFNKCPLIALKVVNPFCKGFKLVQILGHPLEFHKFSMHGIFIYPFFFHCFFIGLACVVYDLTSLQFTKSCTSTVPCFFAKSGGLWSTMKMS